MPLDAPKSDAEVDDPSVESRKCSRVGPLCPPNIGLKPNKM